MANTTLLSTSTVNLAEIFGSGKIYKVPLYQRDYSWKEESWEDLWSDILIVEKSKQRHYMGAIVFQRQKSEKSFIVIDGQQRLCTLSLIALAVIKNIQELIDANIDKKQNLERKELLFGKYLGFKDAVSLRYSSKLFLNENNDDFYQSHILQLRSPLNPSRLNNSERLMWDAFQFFYDKIKSHVSSKNQIKVKKTR